MNNIEKEITNILSKYENELKTIRKNRMKKLFITGRIVREVVEVNGKWIDKEIVELLNLKKNDTIY